EAPGRPAAPAPGGHLGRAARAGGLGCGRHGALRGPARPLTPRARPDGAVELTVLPDRSAPVRSIDSDHDVVRLDDRIGRVPDLDLESLRRGGGDDRDDVQLGGEPDGHLGADGAFGDVGDPTSEAIAGAEFHGGILARHYRIPPRPGATLTKPL